MFVNIVLISYECAISFRLLYHSNAFNNLRENGNIRDNTIFHNLCDKFPLFPKFSFTTFLAYLILNSSEEL